MELILSENVKSLTGSLGSGFGYSIRRRGARFFGMKSPNGNGPQDGHLRFIIKCAELARIRLHIADIRVTAEEFRTAIDEADMWYGDKLVKTPAKQLLDAQQVLDFKSRWNL